MLADNSIKPSNGAFTVAVAAALAALWSAGCGSNQAAVGTLGAGGAGPGDPGSPDAGVDGAPQLRTPPQADLTQPSLSLQGGAALSAGGLGQSGGTVHLVATGALTLDPALATPAAPAVPAAPAGALALAQTALSADVNASGSILIGDGVSSLGAEAVRQITSGGDIFVQGTLRAADRGAGRQGLSLSAPAGTVYVTGVIDTSGASGAGQAGGALSIAAQRVVILGKLMSAGGDGPTAGAAGAVTVTATQGIYLAGLNASGGSAQTAGAAVGGRGGDVKLQAGGDVVLAGMALLRGGYADSLAGDATAGDAGSLTIDGGGTLTFAGAVDGRGGTAVAATQGGKIAGGMAGAIKVGEAAPPATVLVLVPLLLNGGDGVAAGGAGGIAHLEPHTGNLRLASRLDATGGSSALAPGPGGNIFGNPGPDTGGIISAGVDVAGLVVANGGSITAGAGGDGAVGGNIQLVVLSSEGDMTVEATGQVQTDGGQSGGAGHAGGGGLLYLFTRDGNASIHGTLLARGGSAPGAGGTGGGGGFVYVFTDNNHGGTHGGALIIETDGNIDASGGDGAIGGSARNDGHAHQVAIWPVHQDNEYDVEQTAVLINSDGKHGPATGYIDNRGHIIARGGKVNGAGGDVQYHGKRQDGNETPLSGNVDMSGDGTGAGGDFAGE